MRLRFLLLACASLFLGCQRDEPAAGGRPLSHWVGEARQWSLMPWWNSSKDERRAVAFQRLSELGEPAVPALLDLLRSDNVAVSGDALNTLAALGPRAASAVPDLLSMLAGDDARLRPWSAMILGAIGPDAALAVPALTEALRDPDPRMARTAAAALAGIGGTGEDALAVAARAPDAAVRSSALAGLATARLDPAQARRHLEAALDDPSPDVRARGVEMLLGRQAALVETAVDLLVRAMNDSSETVRAAARQAYIVEAQRRPSPRVLGAVLAGGDPGSRADAAWRLGQMLRHRTEGARVTDADAALEGALRDADVTVRIYAARALAAGDGAGRERLAAVLRAELPRADADVAVRGASVLWDLTGRLEEVREPLAAGLAGESRWLRLETLAEIMRIGAAAAPLAPAVEALRDDPDRDVRARAARVLATLAGGETR